MTSATLYSGKPSSTRKNSVRAWGLDLIRFARYFLACLDVARQRRHLLTLGERALKDIGISRADADREASRDFWDIPEDQMPRR